MRVGLSGPRAGDDEKWWRDGTVAAHAVFNRPALLGIEFIQMCRSCRNGWLPQRESVILQ